MSDKIMGIDYELVHDMVVTLKKFGQYFNLDSLSHGQLKSKMWLVEELSKVEKNLGIVFVLCGWYGILPAMLFYSDFEVDKIRSFDIDETANKIADSVNRTYTGQDWKFKAVDQNIFDINFEEHAWQYWSNKNNRMSYPIKDKPTTIINTSCEHTNSFWFNRIPKGKLVILQSNDSFEEEGHTNASTDLEDFKMMYPMSKIHYEGELELPKFTRFMLIGEK